MPSQDVCLSIRLRYTNGRVYCTFLCYPSYTGVVLCRSTSSFEVWSLWRPSKILEGQQTSENLTYVGFLVFREKSIESRRRAVLDCWRLDNGGWICRGDFRTWRQKINCRLLGSATEWTTTEDVRSQTDNDASTLIITRPTMDDQSSFYCDPPPGQFLSPPTTSAQLLKPTFENWY